MTNVDIFSDIYMKEPNENNQNIFQNNNSVKENELIQMNQDRYETKLTLRKKKLTEKISKKRQLDYINNSNNIVFNNSLQNNTSQFNFEKIVKLNESFTDLIPRLSSESKDEEKIKKLLINIIVIIEQRLKSEQNGTELIGNIYEFTVSDLYENNWISSIYELILIYLKDVEMMELITRLLYLSTMFVRIFWRDTDDKLFDNNQKIKKNGYFIFSSDKYVDVYNKIFEIYIKEKNNKIIYFMVIFIANIAEDGKESQNELCTSGILNYVIDCIDIENDNFHELDMKIWCISKFELEEKYNIDLTLSLKIQKIYIEIFLNQSKYNLFDKINENMDECNFFYNFLKVIENLSFCTQVGYVEELYKSNILEFLMDNVNNENQIMIEMVIAIFDNLTNADTYLLKRLIDIGGVKFLITILIDKTINNSIHAHTMVAINNLLDEPLLWNKVLFDNNVLKTFCVLLKDKNIEQNIFAEICYGIDIIMPFCDENNLKIIIDDYYIIQLICIAMKNILENNKLIEPNHCSIFINLIFKFLLEEDDSLSEDIIFKFKSINGLEIVDKIINAYSEIDIKSLPDELKKDIDNIIRIGQIIKDNIKDI